MNRFVLFLSVALLLTSVGWTEETLPSDVVKVIEQRKAAISKIDAIYLKELEKIKSRYTKEGNLEVAVRIDKMIKALNPASLDSVEAILEGDWDYYRFSNNFTDRRSFKGDYMQTSTGERFRWTRIPNGIKIHAGDGNYEMITIDPSQPDILHGEHSNNPSSKFKYTRRSK